MTIWWWW